MKKRFTRTLLTLCILLSIMTVSAFAAEQPSDGWYYLRCMYNYLNLTTSGAAELRSLSENQAFYMESKGDGKVSLKMKDGRYLGLEGDRKNGTRLKAVNSSYVWTIRHENKEGIFSLRPPEAYKMVVNASGEKNADGTAVIIWSHPAQDAPNNAEFRFIPATTAADPTGESWTIYNEKGLVGFKDAAGKVVIPAKYDAAKDFSQGIARVYDKNKDACAFINTAGKLITPFKYYYANSGWSVHDGLVRVGIHGEEVTKAIMNGDSVDYIGDKVMMKSGKALKYAPRCGFIDTTGKEVIPIQYYDAQSFQGGLAAVFQYQGKLKDVDYTKVGWIDTAGKLVIPYKSDDASYYDGSVHSFKDGLVCYFVETDKDPYTLPAVGIMNKTGKVIVAANKDEWFHSDSFGLRWRDGIIAVSPNREVNTKGVPTKGGGHVWSFSSIYDYSGKLIKKLDGYVDAMPIGGGYTLALHQLPDNPKVDVLDIQMNSAYWSVFDRTGKMVIEKVEKNNFYLLNNPAGYDNGYIYFGDSRYKVS